MCGLPLDSGAILSRRTLHTQSDGLFLASRISHGADFAADLDVDALLLKDFHLAGSEENHFMSRFFHTNHKQNMACYDTAPKWNKETVRWEDGVSKRPRCPAIYVDGFPRLAY
eukprot:COSAG01_NODE_453_length_16866_cov_30.622175_3_plen_113_part_00